MAHLLPLPLPPLLLRCTGGSSAATIAYMRDTTSVMLLHVFAELKY